VDVSERAPLNEWVPLSHTGEEIGEARLEPEGDGFTLVVQIPRGRLEPAAASQPLTIETLLEAAATSADDVESWCVGDVFHARTDGTDPELSRPLPPPPPHETYLTVFIQLKSPADLGDQTEGHDPDESLKTWQAMEAIWRSILGLETSIDTLRLSMESLRLELEAAFKKSLVVEEKVHALQADVLQWNKAKNRVHFALPKVREYIHRATWALAVPERKRMDEVVRTHIEPRVPLPDVDHVREQLGHLQKDRQVLFGQGNSVYQEGRAILAEIQRALSTLQRNAADRARAKRSAGREKGKHL
jgi:hypothetical protein